MHAWICVAHNVGWDNHTTVITQVDFLFKTFIFSRPLLTLISAHKSGGLRLSNNNHESRPWWAHVLPEPRANRCMRFILSHCRSPICHVNCCSQALCLPVPLAHNGPRNKPTAAVLSARPDGDSNSLCIASSLIIILQCMPVESGWDPRVKGVCWNFTQILGVGYSQNGMILGGKADPWAQS